jgi:hypothetical protein
MAKVNGKNKGSTFERKIANLLSDKFKNYLGIEKGFRRNPDSGSFFGGQNESRTETYGTEFAIFGDLICPKSFIYSVECKHYKSPPSFQSLLNADIKEWDMWIKQAEQDSVKSSKKMFLIIKYNNVNEFIITDSKIETCRICFYYKNKFVYMLGDILLLDESQFFQS